MSAAPTDRFQAWLENQIAEARAEVERMKAKDEALTFALSAYRTIRGERKP